MLLEKAYIVNEDVWKNLCEKRLKHTNDLNMINEFHSLSFKENKNKYALIDLFGLYGITTYDIEIQLQKGFENKINLIFRDLSYSQHQNVHLKILIKNPIFIKNFKNNLNLKNIELTSYTNKNSYEFIVSQIENQPISYQLKSDLIKILYKYDINSVDMLLNSVINPLNSKQINKYCTDQNLFERLQILIKDSLKQSNNNKS